MSDIIAKSNMSDAAQKIRRALGGYQSSGEASKNNYPITEEPKNNQVEKIKNHLKSLQQDLGITKQKLKSQSSYYVPGEFFTEFNDNLASEPIKDVFSESLVVTQEEVREAIPIITSELKRNKSVVKQEFLPQEYKIFAKAITESFNSIMKLETHKTTERDRPDNQGRAVLGKHTRKIIESDPRNNITQSASIYNDWFAGKGPSAQERVREEYNKYFYRKEEPIKAVTKLNKEKEKAEAFRSPEHTVMHLLRRTKENQERIENKRDLRDLIELLKSSTLVGHNKSGPKR